MPDSPTSEPESEFVCDCEESFRPACKGQRFYKENEGKRYCVLHFPSRDKSADFKAALQRKLENEDFNFREVWFPDEVWFTDFNFTEEANFHKATFSAAANFSNATFGGAADFSNATFGGAADFSNATFNAKANFAGTTFSAEANFSHATFGVADFRIATFNSEANFVGATFSAAAFFSSATFSAAADFRYATFGDYVRFSGNKNRRPFSATSSLNLQFARIEKSDRVWFHTLTLHPHWFVNIDARKFEFINVDWKNSGNAKAEIEILESNDVASSHRLLATACQRLAANCEENSRYRSASHFRRMALDAERLENWRGFDVRRLNWWYWLASGYGERPFQALMVLVAILVLFAALYTQVGFARLEPRIATESESATAARDNIGASLPFSRAMTYSAGVMTLQKPEPKPATTAAQTLVLLETILGPVQGALLALAIRRKFMR